MTQQIEGELLYANFLWRMPSQRAECLLRQWLLISTAMHVPVLAGQVAAVNNSVSRLPVLKVNTVLATNVKLMLN